MHTSFVYYRFIIYRPGERINPIKMIASTSRLPVVLALSRNFATSARSLAKAPLAPTGMSPLMLPQGVEARVDCGEKH
jgi:hypothetical protein